jgi:hypothetical protein
MSALLKQVEEANEKNRRNAHLAMEEFARKLAQEANGIPMRREPNALCEVHRENDTVELILVRI